MVLKGVEDEGYPKTGYSNGSMPLTIFQKLGLPSF